MIARLKLLESDFGCWLETVCDYVFYFFLLTGMTIGQWRASGTKASSLWGGLLLLGATASFLAVGWQRHRIAASRPDQLLSIWQSRAEGRRSNPLLYFARHTELILRRCFFSYALVVFAFFNIMNFAFIFGVKERI
jgi:phosphatidylglycerophosphate synthase